jgi:hypothetical protein
MTVADRCAIHDHGKRKLANKVRQASHFVQKLKRGSAWRFPLARLQTLSRRSAPDAPRPYSPGEYPPTLRARDHAAAIILREKSDCEQNQLVSWLPFLDTYRTMCRAPEPAFRQILEDIRELRFAA